jgi:cation diffusion facilitator CzcD-associated flavoprotein CzcO
MNPTLSTNSPLRSLSVAVIGAGPAGIAVAKHCLEKGLKPVLFEQAAMIGGQWNASSAYSGVWPTMRTNTSHVTTCFSDHDYPEGTAMFPTNQEVHAYLRSYADRFGVSVCVRSSTRVEEIAPLPENRWSIRSMNRNGRVTVDEFDHVVVASGRYNQPTIPKFSGLNSFTGQGGAQHAFFYNGAEEYRGLRVLVVGNSISGLEICSDLATGGAAQVISACRAPRYILNKILAGRPTDCALFSRFAAWAGRALPLEASLEGLRQEILRTCGNPAQYGGLAPADSLLKAKVTQCQHFLPLVAEGKIAVKKEPTHFKGNTVEFADGSTAVIDAVIFATGYELKLPFLSADVRTKLNADASGLDLYHHTFHPDFPTLAFIGLFSQIGSYFPVLELQAKWLSLVWSGEVALPQREAMLAAIRAAGEMRHVQPDVVFHHMALQFAEAMGVEPDVASRPELARALMFGPLAPIQFRIQGPDALPDAAERFAKTAASFGCVTSSEFTPEQRGALTLLASTGAGLAWLTELFETPELAEATA